MTLDLYLTEREMTNLENGGFITTILADGLRVTVTKENECEEE